MTRRTSDNVTAAIFFFGLELWRSRVLGWTCIVTLAMDIFDFSSGDYIQDLSISTDYNIRFLLTSTTDNLLLNLATDKTHTLPMIEALSSESKQPRYWEYSQVTRKVHSHLVSIPFRPQSYPIFRPPGDKLTKWNIFYFESLRPYWPCAYQTGDQNTLYTLFKRQFPLPPKAPVIVPVAYPNIPCSSPRK